MVLHVSDWQMEDRRGKRMEGIHHPPITHLRSLKEPGHSGANAVPRHSKVETLRFWKQQAAQHSHTVSDLTGTYLTFLSPLLNPDTFHMGPSCQKESQQSGNPQMASGSHSDYKCLNLLHLPVLKLHAVQWRNYELSKSFDSSALDTQLKSKKKIGKGKALLILSSI